MAERFSFYDMPIILIGMSIGGAMISKYVGEIGKHGDQNYYLQGKQYNVVAALAVCPPNDFVKMVEHMNRSTYQKSIYQRDMCNDIKNYVLAHEPLQNLPNVDKKYVIDENNISRFSRVIHFDEHIISKSNGYRSLHHYHIDTSAITWLPFAPIPILVLSTLDDPVIGRGVMPHRWKELCHNNPNIVYCESNYGGHMGFLSSPLAELKK
ncbi:hypothetical protein ADEAN_001033400 [Angomonas deanei]|uniref:Uncharacterized protein n=1 Tax=Angomonas deanei TaxID=59799 RepID=A0A7G2CV31_9TRYP|nr:hypothetical protein ADEAN_001033400 [Angomonas deanei]